MASGESESAQLAKFEALRGEVAARSRAQAAAVLLTLAALATLGILAFANYPGDKSLLLLAPLIAACLGLFWFDHAASINFIDSFIKEELRDKLIAAGRIKINEWKARHRTPLRRLYAYAFPFLVFIALPFAFLIVACNRITHHSILFYALSCIDVALIGTELVYLVQLIIGLEIRRRFI